MLFRSSTGGALITADIANSYHRDVFALPGRIHDSQSEGCNQLIKTHRAALIQSAADIRYVMGWDDRETAKKPVQKSMFQELSEEEKIFLQYIESSKSASIDQIAIHLNKSQGRAATVLLNLEFKGIVRCMPGKVYVPA